MAEYYKFEIANWNEGTADLTLEQEAAYLRVVNAIRLADQPITFNKFALCGLWRCNERKANRLLSELIEAGKLRIEGGKIINDKAVEDASNLRRLRADRASAGSRGGIESGKSRAKALENKEAGEAIALTREEKRREENNGGGGSARAREADFTDREMILDAMGVDPSGVIGQSKFTGTQADLAELARWLELPGLTMPVVVEEIRRVCASKADGPPSRWSYFSPIMARLSAALTAPPLQPDARASPPARSTGPDIAAAIARLEAQGRA